MKFRSKESNCHPLLGDTILYFGKQNKTNNFWTCLEVSNPKEDGKKEKEMPFFPTNLKLQRMTLGSEPLVIATLPWCSLMVHLSTTGWFDFTGGTRSFYPERRDAAIFLFPNWCQTSFVCALFSLCQEPMKFVEQLGDPEKPVLTLRKLVSWFPGPVGAQCHW